MQLGFNQVDRPTPVKYERFLSFLISVVVPSTATLIVSLPVATDNIKMYVGLGVTWLLAILNGLKYFIGTDPIKEESK